jgi:hypothetical protein
MLLFLDIAILSQLQTKALARQGFQSSLVRGSFRIAIANQAISLHYLLTCRSSVGLIRDRLFPSHIIQFNGSLKCLGN